jgi:hypothetical protein
MALADCNAAEMLGALMLGLGKTVAVGACVTASPVRSRDSDIYRRYAAGLYRQALLTHGDSALAEHVVRDVIVNECALARIPERGEDDERYRLREKERGALRPALFGGLGYLRASRVLGIYPRDMAALLYAALRRPASSSAAVAEDGRQVRRPAAGGQ